MHYFEHHDLIFSPSYDLQTIADIYLYFRDDKLFVPKVLLIFITSTMFILVYCADFNQDDTYHDVLLSMCGKRAQQISAVSILLTCYGINITFLVIIGDQYDRIFESLLSEYTDEYWVLNRKFTIFITSILFIWPMCYAKRLDFLRHAR